MEGVPSHMTTAHVATKNAKRNGKNQVVKEKGTFRKLRREENHMSFHIF